MAVRMTDDLLQEYRQTKKIKNPQKVLFFEVGDCDVYNPTAPFEYKGKKVICARVERRDSEHSHAVFFYEKEPDCFYPLEGIERFELQDPFITKVCGYYVFGGTAIFPHPEDSSKLWWCTKFFYGKTLDCMEVLATGPNGMKDVRVVELKDGRVGVFTRPQGEIGGRGKIGFTTISSLTDLSADVIDRAELLETFDDEEWGGVNEPRLLEDGRIGVLGHIAKFTPGDVRHYYSMAFVFNPEDRTFTEQRIIAERADLVEGPSKRPDLVDVLFSGGINVNGDGTADLYVGVSDCEVQKLTIPNPFL